MDTKQIGTFLKLLVKLTPIEFAGFCKVMGIKMVDDKKEPIPAEQIINSLTTKYYQSDRQKRRRILKVLRTAGGKEIGTKTGLPEENNQ